jgi:nitroimidazol reductase NimA-like FMN-containing flavoprotein (pyridoxamine 5'-phosphate oxidase superfamily)
MISRLSQEECYELLRGGRVARLGCIADGEPYVVPINYAFEGDSAYVHSLPGRKVLALRDNPRACLQVDDIRDEFAWRSVLAFGRYEELTGAADRARATNLLLALFPKLTPVESLIADDAAAPKPVIFRIHVERVTGLQES